MKRLAAVMMMALLVGACGDSTTGVKTGTNPPDTQEFIPPDSIIDKNGISAEVFGPEHPVAIARESQLAMRADAVAEIDRLEALGYVYVPGHSMAYNLRSPDGRVAEMTILHLDGPDSGAGFSHLVHLRLGDRELLRPIRLREGGDGRLGFEEVVDRAKADGGPQSAWTIKMWECLAQAYADLVACLSSCSPAYYLPCVRACLIMVLANLGACLMFTQS